MKTNQLNAKEQLCRILADMNGPYWLICIKEKHENQIFQSDVDYRNGINLLALGYHESGARILTFTITGKCILAVTAGTRGQQEFLTEIVCRKLSRLIAQQHRVVRIEIREKRIIPITGPERLRSVICFVNSRCQAISPMETANSYRWSCARFFFSHQDPLSAENRIGNLTYRRYRKIFHFRNTGFPQHWLIADDHVYMPSFCSIDEAQAYYADAHTYISSLNSVNTFLDMQEQVWGLTPTPTDTEIRDLSKYLGVGYRTAVSIINRATLP